MIETKFEQLKKMLIGMKRVGVAYSGGIDSTLVAKVAYDCLGDQAVALTAISASLPAQEQAEAEAVLEEIGIRYVPIDTYETNDPRYLANNVDRCYFCKSEVYDKLQRFAQQEAYPYILDGTNADDVGDHRPGRKAARERGVRSPLQELGITKAEIRALAQQLGLPNWDKPAAACLSSRIPYGTSITLQMLSQVERAELALKQMGFRQLRVRHHDQVARIEVEPADFEAVVQQRQEIVEKFEHLGYAYTTLDLVGFRSGSMNEVVTHGH
ncbi:MAG: ATP-dependent sacrificial sulfur transferase LarE [Chloroflexota bacterium]